MNLLPPKASNKVLLGKTKQGPPWKISSALWFKSPCFKMIRARLLNQAIAFKSPRKMHSAKDKKVGCLRSRGKRKRESWEEDRKDTGISTPGNRESNTSLLPRKTSECLPNRKTRILCSIPLCTINEWTTSLFSFCTTTPTTLYRKWVSTCRNGWVLMRKRSSWWWVGCRSWACEPKTSFWESTWTKSTLRRRSTISSSISEDKTPLKTTTSCSPLELLASRPTPPTTLSSTTLSNKTARQSSLFSNRLK